MKLEIEVNNKSKSPVEDKFFFRIIKDTLERSGMNFLKARDINVGLALVNSGEIRKLNRIYRKKDSVTDVLSFSEYKNSSEMENSNGKKMFLGEIILCYNDIKKYSRKEKINFEEELARVVSHGILHLLGFRHGKEMFRIQGEAAKK